MIARPFVSLLAVVAAALLPAFPCRAQLPIGAQTTFLFTPGAMASLIAAVPGGGRCSVASSTGPVSGACAGSGISLAGQARATPGGTLGAAATFSATNNALSALGYTGAFAFADASVTDALTFSTASTGPLRVTFRLAADGSSSVPNPPGAAPETPDAQGLVAEGQYGIVFGGQQYDAFLTGANASSTTDFSVFVLPGQSQSVSFYLLALAGIQGNPLPLSGTASADFFNSMRVVGMTVQDAAGRDVSGAVTVASALGVGYTLLPASTVPEPTTLTLLGLGVAVTATARRRRV